MLLANNCKLVVGDLLLFSASDQFEVGIASSFSPNPNNFYHVAIYVGDDAIIEASQENGVRKRKLKACEKYNIYRFTGDIDLNQVVTIISSKLGCGYNHYFQDRTDCFYCSQLIQYGFNHVAPETIPYIEMQFTDTSDFCWEAYYEQKGIPFNKKGTHPASIILKNFKLLS